MCRKFLCLVSFVLVLGLASNTFAAVPAPWDHQDIGAVSIAGDAFYTGSGAFRIVGDGGDIWDATDRFHYLYTPLSGNGEIQARVTSLVQTDGWAKTGVMIREQLTDTSSMAMMIATPPGGTNLFCFQWVNGATRNQNVQGGAISAFPVWVKIVRSGNDFTGYYAPDNSGSPGTWVQESMQTIPMAANVYIGLCLTSHTDGALSTATLDKVSGTVTIPPWLYSGNPTPANGSMVNADSAFLHWSPGDLAALHDVYVSTSFNDVNTADSSDPMGSDKVYKARQTELQYPPGPFDAMPVARGETYYWRIDEVEGVDIWRGDVWSFTIVPNINYNPNPPHQDTFVAVTTDLSWSKGNYAVRGHIVYLSTDFATVNNKPTGSMSGAGYLAATPPQTVRSLTRTIPGDLLYNTTYYWRADAVENIPPTMPGYTHKGTVWEFKTTLAGTGSILREIWDNITPTGTAISLLYNWPDFPENPTTSDLLTSFDSASHGDARDQFGGRIHGWVYAPKSGDYTFYIASDDNGELWLSTDVNPANAQLIAYETDWAGDKAWQMGAERSGPIPLVGGNKYYIGALWKEAPAATTARSAGQVLASQPLRLFPVVS